MGSRAVDSARAGLRARLRGPLLRLRLFIGIFVFIGVIVAVTACGGGNGTAAPSAPTTPTTPSTPTPTPSNDWSIGGHLLAYGSGRPIAGAHLTSSNLGPTDTDAQGGFRFSGTSAPAQTQARVTIEAGNYLTREASLRWQRGAREDVALDLIPLAAPFSLDFYRQFVRNTYDEPTKMEPLRRWTDNPRFYVRTVDEAGKPIEPEVLALVIATIPRAVQAFTSGRFTAAQIEQGSDARPWTTGWINVIFRRDPKSERCGQAYVGANPGEMTLWDDRCSCGSVKVPSDLVMHEMGHAMGFWHVADRRSVMHAGLDGSCSSGEMSSSEQFHTALAYSRSPGNLDPDSEPSSTLFALPSGEAAPPVVICPARR